MSLQELSGILLSYYAARVLMFQSAVSHDLDYDRLSLPPFCLTISYGSAEPCAWNLAFYLGKPRGFFLEMFPRLFVTFLTPFC